jgi:hypothetical protein
LLANTVYQCQMSWLIHRIREQARSHICFVVFTKSVSRLRTNLLPNAPAWRKTFLSLQPLCTTNNLCKKFHQVQRP